MRALARLLFLLLPVGAAIACGGRVDGTGQSGSCPASSALVTGAACTSQGLTCPIEGTDDCPGESAGAVQCTCSGGTWLCPVKHGGCPQPQPTQTPPPPPPPQPQPTCPVPGNFYDGLACPGDEGLACPSDIPVEDCYGNVVGSVTCYCKLGTWSCPAPELTACADGGPAFDAGPWTDATPPSTGCPNPYSVVQGVACGDPGLVCAGSPSWCDGQIDYDAFECVGGVWSDIATTVCAGEGGVVDAGVSD